LRYRPTTDTVLNSLSFMVEPGMKVGVVGRTGAGKSTLALTLSRILEVESGSIEIDGLNIR
jgi:ATP-binding cassette subfamily C (CFTR/MRP) protein 1